MMAAVTVLRLIMGDGVLPTMEAVTLLNTHHIGDS